MFRRFVIVCMLVLFPLQWGVAQAHELKDDARGMELSVSAAFSAGEQASNLLQSHQQDPGGVCQFHELAQPMAGCLAEGLTLSLQLNPWSRARRFDHQGRDWLTDIERPKWNHPAPFVAGSETA